MKGSTIWWHVIRHQNNPGALSNQRLARFCEKNRASQEKRADHYIIDGVEYFQILYRFNNGGFIRAELKAGTKNQGYTVADHFEIVEHGFGGWNGEVDGVGVRA